MLAQSGWRAAESAGCAGESPGGACVGEWAGIFPLESLKESAGLELGVMESSSAAFRTGALGMDRDWSISVMS